MTLTDPVPTQSAPDQDALRASIRAAAGPPASFGGRLGWIAATALKTFLYPWTYLILLGYIIAIGSIWSLLLFFAAFTTLFLVAIVPDPVFAGVATFGFLAIALLTVGWAASGYNAGLIRMLAPMIAGRGPDAIAFFSAIPVLGFRLLVVFGAALLLACIPIWMLVSFFAQLIQHYGLETIASPWNKTLQWWILEETGRRLLSITLTIATLNILLGPWQAMVGTHRINLFAALPATLMSLARQLPTAVIVLGAIGAAHWGLRVWSETVPWGALAVQVLITPPAWMAILCLVASDYEPETPRPRVRRTGSAPARMSLGPAAQPSGPAQHPRNPAPGLMG